MLDSVTSIYHAPRGGDTVDILERNPVSPFGSPGSFGNDFYRPNLEEQKTRNTAASRTEGFVNGFSASLPDFSNYSYEDLYRLYNSFNPIAEAYKYYSTATAGDPSKEAKEAILNVANSYKDNIAQRLEQLMTESNSIGSQVIQQRQAGINPDFNGVSFTPSGVSQPSHSAVPQNFQREPLEIVDSVMNLLSSGANIASGISGVAGSASSMALDKINLAAKVADLSKTLVSTGVESADGLGYSRQMTRRINKGIQAIPQSERSLIAARKGADMVNSLLSEAKGSSELKLLPLFTELQRIQMLGDKVYNETLDHRLKAKRENSQNSYDSSRFDSLDPLHQSRTEALQETLLNDEHSLNDLRASAVSQDMKLDLQRASDLHRSAEDSHKSQEFLVNERELAKIKREAFDKSIDAQISAISKEINRLESKSLTSPFYQKEITALRVTMYRLRSAQYKNYRLVYDDMNGASYDIGREQDADSRRWWESFGSTASKF